MTRPLLLAALFLAAAPFAFADKRKDRDESYVHASEPGRYSVRFPKPPRGERKEMATAAGVLHLVTDRCDMGRDLFFSVTWCDYPESFEALEPAKLLDGVRDGLRGKDGVVRQERISADGDATGRELRIEAGKNVLRARILLDGRRLYQVLVAGPRDRVDLPQADEFFRSFALRK